MTGEHAVGRVIARPVRRASRAASTAARDGATTRRRRPGARTWRSSRTPGCRFTRWARSATCSPASGIDEKHEGATNAKGIAVDHASCSSELDSGLIFVNLVETDQVYGHRHDVEGFHAALREIDAAVAGWLELLRDDDLLVLTADHGVDPNAPHTDHTREYAPLLAVFAGNDGRRHDGPLADVGASALRWLTGREAPELPGEPFV